MDESQNSKKENKYCNWAIEMKAKRETNLIYSQTDIIPENINSELKEMKSTLNIRALIDKSAEIVSRSNDPELEMDFRRICSLYESEPSILDQSLMRAYQYFLKMYQQNSSVYNIIIDDDDNTRLCIYNSETGSKEVKMLQTTEYLDNITCITQIPNSKLFCYGRYYPVSGVTAIIDENFDVQLLPSGTVCTFSSGIYLNHNVYCFGGWNNDNYLTLSCRFDLDENRWIKLASLPNADFMCNSVIFNGSILISGWSNRNLFLYSIDIDSFSIIPHDFEVNKRKLLINAERLYLIECDGGSIYESEFENESIWTRIADSKINIDPDQVYFSYNKRSIYIGAIEDDSVEYYKFDLDKKLIIGLL